MIQLILALVLVYIIFLNSQEIKPDYDVIVVGGGLAGLSTAYGLNNPDVLLLEKSAKLGGRVSTIYLDGIALDTGAIMIFSRNIPFGQVTVINEAPSGLYFNNKLHLCQNVFDCIEGVDITDKEKEDLFKFSTDYNMKLEDLTLDSNRLLSILFQHVHPAPIVKYSPYAQRFAFQRFPLEYFENGSQTLIDEFEKRIKGKISLNSTVTSIEDEEGTVKVTFERNGIKEVVSAKAVVVATPANVAKWIIDKKNKESERFMGSIEYAKIISISLLIRTGRMTNFSYFIANGLGISTIYRTHKQKGLEQLSIFYKEDKNLSDISDDDLILKVIGEINRAEIGNLSKKDLIYSLIEKDIICGSIISQESYSNWDEKNIRPSSRVFLTGDYTWVEYPYATSSAMRAGTKTAEKIKNFLNS